MWRWLDPKVDWIDGAYWTLFVEVRFYLLMAAIYFCLPRRHAVLILGTYTLVGMAVYSVAHHFALEPATRIMEYVLMPHTLGWFACGAVYSEMMEARQRRHSGLLALLIPASLLGPPISAPSAQYLISLLAWGVAFHAVFLSLVHDLGWIRVFRWRPLVWLGTISYSLYLVHQNLGLALISRIPRDWPLISQLAVSLVVIGAMVGAALASWTYLERRHPFTAMTRSRSRV